METRIRPVPAFYCCYLLRSTIRHSSLYVGSSPHPTRRLAQHNGKAKGGAVRTSRATLRPWEMVCIVAGFPSNIAALQFEWAWQNAHLTRHISSNDRISIPTTRVKTNTKTGKSRKKIGRPRTSLVDKLSNLHLLLRAPYFSKWPLELRFFNQDVHRHWLAWTQRVDGQIPCDIPVLLDLAQPTEDDIEPSSAQKPPQKRKVDLIGKGGVEGVDPTYARFQSVLRKFQERCNEKTEPLVCDICEVCLDRNKDLFNICLDQDCASVTHMSCLSAQFLRDDKSRAESLAIVPKTGRCPSCTTMMDWADLMRIQSLRLRGDKEVKKLLKKRNRGAAGVAAELLEEEDENSANEEADVAEEGSDESMAHGSELGSDDTASIASVPFIHSPTLPDRPPDVDERWTNHFEIVIGDSEDER